MESSVETALQTLLRERRFGCAEQVKALVAPARPTVPHVEINPVDLGAYDLLIGEAEVAS